MKLRNRMGQWAEASQAGLISRVEGTDSLPHIAFRHPIKYTVLVSWHGHGSRVASTCLLSDLSTFVSKPLSGNELPSNCVTGREEDTKTSKRKNSLSLKTTKRQSCVYRPCYCLSHDIKNAHSEKKRKS